jgi:hypothetical protein
MPRRGKLVDDYREFTREILLRIDNHMAAMRADGQAHREELRAQRAESRAYHERETKRLDEILEHSREIRAECRDHRRALLSVLDKLDNGGTAPAG